MSTCPRRPAAGTFGSRSRTLSLLVGALLVAGALLVVPASVAHAETGSDYVPLSPTAHLVDTRNGTGGVTGARGPGSTTTFRCSAVRGCPPPGSPPSWSTSPP